MTCIPAKSTGEIHHRVTASLDEHGQEINTAVNVAKSAHSMRHNISTAFAEHIIAQEGATTNGWLERAQCLAIPSKHG